MPEKKHKIGEASQIKTEHSKCYEIQRSGARDDLTRAYKKRDPSDPWRQVITLTGSVNALSELGN